MHCINNVVIWFLVYISAAMTRAEVVRDKFENLWVDLGPYSRSVNDGDNRYQMIMTEGLPRAIGIQAKANTNSIDVLVFATIVATGDAVGDVSSYNETSQYNSSGSLRPEDYIRFPEINPISTQVTGEQEPSGVLIDKFEVMPIKSDVADLMDEGKSLILVVHSSNTQVYLEIDLIIQPNCGMVDIDPCENGKSGTADPFVKFFSFSISRKVLNYDIFSNVSIVHVPPDLGLNSTSIKITDNSTTKTSRSWDYFPPDEGFIVGNPTDLSTLNFAAPDTCPLLPGPDKKKDLDNSSTSFSFTLAASSFSLSKTRYVFAIRRRASLPENSEARCDPIRIVVYDGSGLIYKDTNEPAKCITKLKEVSCDGFGTVGIIIIAMILLAFLILVAIVIKLSLARRNGGCFNMFFCGRKKTFDYEGQTTKSMKQSDTR